MTERVLPADAGTLLQNPPDALNNLQTAPTKPRVMVPRQPLIPKAFSSLNPSAETTVKYGTRPEEAAELFASAGIKLSPEECVDFAQYWSKQKIPEDLQDAREWIACCVRQMSRRSRTLYCVNVRVIARKMAESYWKHQAPDSIHSKPPVATEQKRRFSFRSYNAEEARDVQRKIKKILRKTRKIRLAEAKLDLTPCPEKPDGFFQKPVLPTQKPVLPVQNPTLPVQNGPGPRLKINLAPKFPLAKLKQIAAEHQLPITTTHETWDAKGIIDIHPHPKATEEAIQAALKIAQAQGDLCPSSESEDGGSYEEYENYEDWVDRDDYDEDSDTSTLYSEILVGQAVEISSDETSRTTPGMTHRINETQGHPEAYTGFTLFDGTKQEERELTVMGDNDMVRSYVDDLRELV